MAPIFSRRKGRLGGERFGTPGGAGPPHCGRSVTLTLTLTLTRTGLGPPHCGRSASPDGPNPPSTQSRLHAATASPPHRGSSRGASAGSGSRPRQSRAGHPRPQPHSEHMSETNRLRPNPDPKPPTLVARATSAVSGTKDSVAQPICMHEAVSRVACAIREGRRVHGPPVRAWAGCRVGDLTPAGLVEDAPPTGDRDPRFEPHRAKAVKLRGRPKRQV